MVPNHARFQLRHAPFEVERMRFELTSRDPKSRILTWLNYLSMNTLDRCYANVAEFPTVLLQDACNRRASKFLLAGCQSGSQSYLLFDYGWLLPSPPPKCCSVTTRFRGHCIYTCHCRGGAACALLSSAPS